MRKFKVMTVIIVSAIILISSCHKDTVPPNVQASEYFPNTVGDKWIYRVYDSVNKRMDIVTVEVTGTTKLPKGETATIWIYRYPTKNDTNYVLQTGDTTKFIPALNLNPNDYYVKKIYISPLAIGRSWTNTFIYDTIKVLNETQLSICDNIKFDSVYFLREKGQTVNYLIYAEEYFKPQVGLVQLSKYEYDFAPAENKVWYLKEYYLK
jgi:hypothetical protein